MILALAAERSKKAFLSSVTSRRQAGGEEGQLWGAREQGDVEGAREQGAVGAQRSYGQAQPLSGLIDRSLA